MLLLAAGGLLAGLVSCTQPEPRPRGSDSQLGVRPAPERPVESRPQEDRSVVAAAEPAPLPRPVEPSAPIEAPAEAAAAPERAKELGRSFAEFRPSQHGFRFVNRFAGTPLPIAGTGLEKGLRLPEEFGLCGGMSFAAADYFLAGRAMPPDSTPPERGSSLYDYLYGRQVSTLAPAGMQALKFLEWMGLPEAGSDGTHARTLAELGEIVEALDRGEPVLLGLVLVGRGEAASEENRRQAIWQNHQVLAYAARRLPMSVVELSIYDPNYPQRDDVTIRVIGEPEVRMSRLVPRGRATAVRGFFRMPYAAAQPPEAVSALGSGLGDRRVK
jgi:hypothetical protein